MLCCRRTNLLAFSLLCFAGLFLLLLFELSSVIQATPREALASIQTSSHHEIETSSRQAHIDYDGQAVESHDNDHELRSKMRLNYVKSGSVISAVSPRKTTESVKSLCAEIKEESRFRAIKKGTLVYSAWFDDRQSQHFIRVLLLTSTRHPPPLFCHFKSASKQNRVISSVSFYQHNENHHMHFGGFIASCVLPSEFDSMPCFVNISTSSTQNESPGSVLLPVGLIDHQHHFAEKVSLGQYGICIPPLHGEILVDRLIEFLELSQILGASYFTFYDLEVSDEVRKVLNYYEDKGLARVLPWKLPSYIGKYDIHYFGQTLSIMDCLFRSMSHLDFVAFNDLDEFIVPLQHDSMVSLLEKIHQDEYCGHCFHSVIFDPLREDLEISTLLTQRVFHRTNAIPFWSKCVVNPRRIFEQGVHHISKPIEDYYIVDNVDWSIARVFHYRKCDDSLALLDPECSGVEQDKTMQKYGEQLQRNFELTQAELDNFSTDN